MGFDARAIFTAYMDRSVFLSPALSYSGWSNMELTRTKAWGYYADDPTDPRNVNATYPRPVYNGFDAIDSDRATGFLQNDIWIVNGNFLSLRVSRWVILYLRTHSKVQISRGAVSISAVYNLPMQLERSAKRHESGRNL